MRFFYDTEFIENGSTIELISIGIVAEDGREYYAVSTDFHSKDANDWVKTHVLNQLPNPSSPQWRSRERIREEVFEFLTQGSTDPELWAWVGAYDHIVLAQLWGDMSGLPRQIPRFTRELKQYWEMAGSPALPKSPSGVHNALIDARHNRTKFDICQRHLPLGPTGAVAKTGAPLG